jgi:hypothetical protein
MTQAITSGAFAMAFVSLLVLGLVSRVQARDCSNARSKGTYGFSCEGTIVGVGPLAASGVFTADGPGHGAEVETLSVNGEISRGVFRTDTYTVEADGTGSFVRTGPDGSVIHNDFVSDDHQQEIRLIATEPGWVAFCLFRKQ